MFKCGSGEELRRDILNKKKEYLELVESIFFYQENMLKKEICSSLFDNVKDDVKFILKAKKDKTTSHHATGGEHVKFHSSNNIESRYENGSKKCTYNGQLFVKYKKNSNEIMYEIPMNDEGKYHGRVIINKENTSYILEFDDGFQKGSIIKKVNGNKIFHIEKSNRYKFDGLVRFENKTIIFESGNVVEINVADSIICKKNSASENITYVKYANQFKYEDEVINIYYHIRITKETIDSINLDSFFSDLDYSAESFFNGTRDLTFSVDAKVNERDSIEITFDGDRDYHFRCDIIEGLNP